MTVTYLRERDTDPPRPPRVAFAVGRPVGSATVRNRVRRRLRAAMEQRARSSSLEPGAYLVSAGPGLVDLEWSALERRLDEALSRAHRS